MPYDEVMGKYKRGELHSGSKAGPKVIKRSQAVAIMLSEKKAAEKGKEEYKPKKYDKGGEVYDDPKKLTREPTRRQYYEIPAEGSEPLNPANMPHSVTPGGNILPATPSDALKKGGPVTKHSEKKGWRRW